MAAPSQQTATPSELAERLLAERDAIAKFVATLEGLEASVRAQETRYGIASTDNHVAIEDGRLTETEDVCRWLMDYELLERARAVAR